MKILITGSSGFIGGFLLDRLKKHHDVYCLKNDLRDHAAIEQEVLSVNPDIIVHLAARTEVEKKFLRTNGF